MNLLQNGDLLLFEPNIGFEITDLFSSYINGSKFGHCGIVLIQDGISYCAQCLKKTDEGTFEIQMEKLSTIKKQYSGQIWVRRLNYFDNFFLKFKEVVKMLKYKNISDVFEYSSAFVCYIYSHIGILNFQQDWKKCLTKYFGTIDNKALVLWFYSIKKETKLTEDMYY